MTRVLLLALALTQPIQWRDLPAAVRARIPATDETTFGALRRQLGTRTAERLRRGEDEHLFYYVAQSKSFTRRAALEPALLDPASADAQIAVKQRIRDFLAALERPSRDLRMRWWQDHLARVRRNEQALLLAWNEAWQFLRSMQYSARGHSSDTSLAPSYSVWNALGVIRGIHQGGRFGRVLIVGPGVDFAPRTGFREDLPPQSYQPVLTAESILRLGLGDAKRLEIVCADVNPRVLAFVARSQQVQLPSEVGNADYQAWLRDIGPGASFQRLRGERLNILTERLAGEQFDVIIATNVLVYFNAVELPLALANIAAMLRPRGYFIHNEARPELEAIARELGMPAIQGRAIEIAKGTRSPLMDVVVIHQRGT
jgi:SAM-dependent methyltransferase